MPAFVVAWKVNSTCRVTLEIFHFLELTQIRARKKEIWCQREFYAWFGLVIVPELIHCQELLMSGLITLLGAASEEEVDKCLTVT